MNDLKGIIEDCNKSDLISDKVIKKIIEIIGQEEWYELNDENNDVCTTMGELIITLKGITELEKENAELKDDNKVMADNLTKAKELLTRFVMASVYFNGKETDLIKEAEQFISEVEK